MKLRHLLPAPVLALNCTASFAQRREAGSLIMDGVSEIPARMNQYQNPRSAAFADWNANGPGMLIHTRFGETNQTHLKSARRTLKILLVH